MTSSTTLTRVPDRSSSDSLSFIVDSVTRIASDIVHVVLGPADGTILPSFTPGSHVIVDCGDGRRNAYSLTGDEFAPTTYEISVRHDPGGSGGSGWIHSLAPGDAVVTSRPRSFFPPVLAGRHHVLVAGGIGVTPILSHLRSAARWRRSVEVVYSHRPEAPAHLEEITDICAGIGARLRLTHSTEETVTAVDDVLSSSVIGSHLYICGPAAMIAAVREAATAHGWPDVRVHYEAFAAPALAAGEPFVMEVAGPDGAGSRVEVPADVSALDALEAAGYDVPNLCRQGVCGECKTAVRSGVPHHRDMVLSAEEKRSGAWFMPCVSRCEGDALEVILP